MEPISTATVMAVSAAITVGTKMWDYFSGKSAARDAKERLDKQKDTIMSGKTSIAQSFEGEMGMADDRTKSALKDLTTVTQGKLEEMKGKESDRVSTLAGSGAEKRNILKSEKSVWDSYLTQSDAIKDKAEDMKISAYSRMGTGVSGVEGQYDQLISDIESLGV